MPKRYFLLLLLFLGGCSTIGGSSLGVALENRLACTVAKDKAFVVSQYGPIGVSSVIAAQDVAVVCK